MSDGRTMWWPKDSAWWRREYVVELGEEFGPAGPAVLDWLSCEAKAQNDGGIVKSGHRSVSRGCFVGVVTVGHVLSRSVAVGALDDFQEDRGRFSCRISGWKTDNDRGRAAVRKQEERNRKLEDNGSTEPDPENGTAVTKRDESRSVTPRHGESRNVTLREEKRRRKDPPNPPKGGRKRDRESQEREISAWVAEHPVTDELCSAWESIRTDLSKTIDGPTFRIHIDPLHLHADGEELVVGVQSQQARWVEDRFGVLIRSASSKPVRFINCGCAVTREQAA
jgi:hypothetical protein